MAIQQKREQHMLRIVSEGDGIHTTSGLRFMVGDRELGDVKSFKLGERNGDGTVRANDIVYVTMEVAVKLG